MKKIVLKLLMIIGWCSLFITGCVKPQPETYKEYKEQKKENKSTALTKKLEIKKTVETKKVINKPKTLFAVTGEKVEVNEYNGSFSSYEVKQKDISK